MGLFDRHDALRTIAVPGTQDSFPVFEKEGTGEGPQVLITAGMDGDEYDGIDAAYRFIAEYKTAPFVGRLTVIPLVNRSGYYSETSRNPADWQYPKAVYPGSPSGSPTERLVSAVVSAAFPGPVFWIDLHGGSLTERLDPYVWAYETGVRDVNRRTSSFIRHLSDDTVVWEKTAWDKPGRIAADGASYVMSEAGDGAGRSEAAVAIHLRRIKAVLMSLGMIAPSLSQGNPVDVYRKVRYATSPIDGIWYPERGTVTSCDLSASRSVSVPGGRTLWTHAGMAVKSHDIVGAIAYEKTNRLP